MNTQEIAEKLVEMNREGQFPDVYQQLYAEGFSSHEMPGLPNELCTGMEEVLKKGEWWMNNTEMHDTKTSDPLVADDWFSVTYWMDTTDKNTGIRKQETELAVYQVKDGKIVSERFFYNV